MEHLTPLLVVLRLGAAALTLVLVLLGVRAYKRTRDDRMLRLTVGFAALLASLLIEGAMYRYVAPNDLLLAHIVEAGAQLLAFAVLVWALF
jgi:hypothetical protein